MFVDRDGNVYFGHLQPGDREATPEEAVAYASARIRETTLLDINEARDAKLAGGMLWNGRLYHCDTTFLTELLGMVMGYQAGVLTGPQAIRTRSNGTVLHTAAEVTELARVVGDYRRTVYVESWNAKDQL